jgi:polyhydroxyalkanoate synthesis regulator phasin
MLDTTRAVVRKSLLAMLGAITLADDELEQLLDRLAARGEQAARERFNHIEALRNRLTGSEGAILEGALLRQTLQEEIERQGRLLAAALDLPTRDSINLLREQIEQISLAIDQIVTQHTPVIAPIDNGQTPAPTPAAAVPQPDAVEAPAAAVPQPDAVEAPAAAVPQPDAVEAPAAAVPQPEAVEAPAAAVPQPDAVEAPAAATAVTQPELGEPSTPTMTAPVAGYDALNAKQAAAIVAELEEADLLALYQYEQAHRNRITVLRAIEAALARHRGES